MSSLRDLVEKASGDYVVRSGARLGGSVHTYPFVDASHLLANGKIADSLRASVGSVTIDAPLRDELSLFLALTTAFHLLDGWRYLSKSAIALLSGASRAATHLAYYAELRAARSFLASSGVYIGDKEHFIFDDTGGLTWLGMKATNSPKSVREFVSNILLPLASRDPIARRAAVAKFKRAVLGTLSALPEKQMGTHVAVWEAVKAWATVPSSAADASKYFRCLRFSGIDWVDTCAMSTAPGAILESWLTYWAVDLRALARDSHTRNLASYGVDGQQSAFQPVQENAVQLILAANRAAIQSPGVGADLADLAMLNDFCFKAARIIQPVDANGIPIKVKTRNNGLIWDRLVQRLVDTGKFDNEVDAKNVVDMVRNARTNAGMFILDSALPSNEGPDGVFSRAYLLLRLASEKQRDYWMSVRQLLSHSSCQWHDVLLEDFASHCNLLTAAELSGGYADFEEDIVTAVDDFETWQNSRSFLGRDAWSQAPQLLIELCRFERIALLRAQL